MPCVTWHHRAGVQPLLSRSIVYSFKIVRGKNQEKMTQKNQLTTQRQHYLVIVRKFWPSERPLMVYFLGWLLWSLRDPECFIKQIFWPPSDEYYYCLFKYQFWSLQTYSYRLDHLLHWSLSQGPPSLSAMRPLLHKSVPGMWASYVVFMYKQAWNFDVSRYWSMMGAQLLAGKFYLLSFLWCTFGKWQSLMLNTETGLVSTINEKALF